MFLTVSEKGKRLYTLPWELTVQIMRSNRRRFILKRYGSRPDLVKGSWEKSDEDICLCFEQQLNIDREDVIELYTVVATNNLSVYDPDSPPDRKCAFFKWFSTVNHSCEPNATLVTDDYAKGAMSLVAVKDIAQGDEITIPYISFNSDPGKAARQAIILHEYAFACRCTKCEAE